MPTELTSKYLPYVDEKFITESKAAKLTNRDFTFDGAHTVKIRKVTTAPMNNYGRQGPAQGNWSRYGAISDLNSDVETLTLTQDRSFTFVIDKLDENEAAGSLAPAKALERQMREVVLPEIDAYTFAKMVSNAGTVREIPKSAFNKSMIYSAVLDASEILDQRRVPSEGRVLVVPPRTFKYLKETPSIAMHMDVGADVIKNGIIAMLDGMEVMRVPSGVLPLEIAFMIVHPCACVGVQKLQDYRIHSDPPGISGSLVEGRIAYDVFPLENKVKAIYAAALVDELEYFLV